MAKHSSVTCSCSINNNTFNKTRCVRRPFHTYTHYRTIILPLVLYGCETWSLTMKQKRRLRVFQKMTLGRIFGPLVVVLRSFAPLPPTQSPQHTVQNTYATALVFWRSWWWANTPETCRASPTATINIYNSCIKLVFFHTCVGMLRHSAKPIL
jgi:hypothetical protein